MQYFRKEEWGNAHNAYASAIKASDWLYLGTASESGRQGELGDTSDFGANDAYCLAKLNRLAEAAECLERRLARALSEDLARDHAALGGVNAEDRRAFEAVRDRVKVLEVQARGGRNGFSGERSEGVFVELSQALAAARGELSVIVERIREYCPEFMGEGLTYGEIARSATTDRPLVYLVTTTKGSLAMIVMAALQETGERQAVWLDEFTLDDLHSLLLEQNERGQAVGGLLVGQVLGDLEKLRSALDHALDVLGKALVGPLRRPLDLAGT